MGEPKIFWVHRTTISEYHNIVSAIIQHSLEVIIVKFDKLIFGGRLAYGMVPLRYRVGSVKTAGIIGAYPAVIERCIVKQRLHVVG